ncbi:MAG TPA: thioredoxin domain-containing protein [Candidatus Paceibacterota bacterium]|nr:thioredoxin domain-containing protein [Candidatus Paceibacterota bacterium]
MEPQHHESTKKEKDNKNSISIPAAIISGAVIIALALIIALGGGKRAAAPTTDTTPPSTTPTTPTSVPADVATIRPDDHVRGDPSKAQVAIIEYSDSDCPFCERFHPVLQQLFDDYKGKVVWVYRFFPLTSLHPNASTEAVALQCVGDLGGNDAFNTYLDKIINITLNPDPKSNEELTTLAVAQGIDGNLFNKCIAGTAASDVVKADADEAVKIGAQGTPFTILVNLKTGKQIIVPGAYSYDDVKKDIDSLLQ